MRLTVLTQYAKGLAHHNPREATDLRDRLERIRWKLWHGDGREALARIEDLADDVDGLESDYPNLKRFVVAANEFATYIRNNMASIPNYGVRWRYGEPISTGFVESTVNVVVGKRFAKKQQMQWSKLGAHRLLQTAGSAGGISPPAAHRTVRKPLDLHGSSQPLPCHLAMTVDAESDRSSRSLGWRPPSLSWVIRFAPRSLQALRHYYRMIRPRHAHRYFPPSCFAFIGFSLGMT